MVANDLSGPDVGVDLDLAKKALIDWLIKHGKVAPNHAQLCAMLKQMARADSSFGEYLALLIMVSHQSLHAHDTATSSEPKSREEPNCKSRPCKTAAVGEVLTEIYKCAADRSGHWARLVNSLGPIVDALEALNLSELEKGASAVQSLQHAVPGQPEYDHYFSLLPTLDPAGLLAQVMSRHPAFEGLQTSDVDAMKHELAPCSFVAAIYGALGLQVVGMLRDAINLAVKLRAQLRTMVPPHAVRDKRPGRPRHDWLNLRRRTLRDAKFSEPQIAAFLPNEPLTTDQQRRYATERVRKGVSGAAHRRRRAKVTATAVGNS